LPADALHPPGAVHRAARSGGDGHGQGLQL
ncbi:MAG: Type II/IV secretion system protein TadC, associated with Flp pilus assembly, partial [uncultured Friedmanniella sp.]